MKLPWILVAVLSAVITTGVGWTVGHAHPRTVYHTHSVVHVVTRTAAKSTTVTKWRTHTRIVTVNNPSLLQCAEDLMGAWETDGQYADVQQLPPSAAQGYDPDVSACKAFPAVWNTPPDRRP